MSSDGNESAMGQTQRTTSFISYSPGDVRGLEEWARLRCRGNSVDQLAVAHGVEARLEVVVRFLARGLAGDSRTAVERVCKEELSRASDRHLP